MSSFEQLLHSGRVLLMDGAMGTELQRVGLGPNDNAAAWNQLHPARVRAVHEAYHAAGAEVFLTNTFLLNSAAHAQAIHAAGRSSGVFAAWRAAYDLVSFPGGYFLAAVGPVSGTSTAREFDRLNLCWIPTKAYRYTVFEGCRPPDGVLLETCSSPRVRYAIRRLREDCTLPIFLSLAYQGGEHGQLTTFSGHLPEWFAERAADWGLAALGVNCGREIDIGAMAEVLRRYRRLTDLPLFARPNAGTPRQVRKRWVYPHTPEQMAAQLPELLEAGACMVGGCCGTTPEHIAALQPVVAAWNARQGFPAPGAPP